LTVVAHDDPDRAGRGDVVDAGDALDVVKEGNLMWSKKAKAYARPRAC
jgi:hypothetical protein